MTTPFLIFVKYFSSSYILHNSSNHTLERMQERGVTKEMADS